VIVYLDESYDQPNKRFLFLGLLFSPSKELHRLLTDIHKKKRCLDRRRNIIETKYNNCFSSHNYEVCRDFIAAFVASDSWFCCIAVDTQTTTFNLSYFGKPHEPEALKKARVYKKFTELLISKNTRRIKNAVLLVDEVARCNHDRFVELIRESFCTPGKGYSTDEKYPVFRHISATKSDSPENVRLCVCDLLLGCVLNNNLAAHNRWKNGLRNYLVTRLGINDLLEITWTGKAIDPKIRRKFRVWYWKPKIKSAQVPDHQR
jgi:hypothetical protein